MDEEDLHFAIESHFEGDRVYKVSTDIMTQMAKRLDHKTATRSASKGKEEWVPRAKSSKAPASPLIAQPLPKAVTECSNSKGGRQS